MATAPALSRVLAVLEEIAPLELAAEWDNVGLLLDARGPRRRIRCVMLTIDLTDEVVAEARRARADLVVAYHPAIFRPLRRLRSDDGKQRAVLAAADAGCAVWSPHTALDAAPGGIADWLADGVLDGAEARVRRPCGDGGFGRVIELPRAVTFASLVALVKRQLGRKHLQIARPPRAKAAVRVVAVAAGAGSDVLRGERADAWVTGEMSHHDVLAAVAAGTSVILAGHSNTERGYLRVLRRRLRKALGPDVEVRVARSDRDPLTVV